MNVIAMHVIAIVSLLAAATAAVSAALADRRNRAMVPVRIKRDDRR